ncbi:uncharacterized protein LOC120125858 [Hibiscus syriacus]|uniref:uncharacterized protein LOC120125858 n=1 Tax=Hibiscus syriacus TaxID=106335 RepID=UPI001920960B|nr:uncharacterized protein LOC120125858 [Hibiscus syriacus]
MEIKLDYVSNLMETYNVSPWLMSFGSLPHPCHIFCVVFKGYKIAGIGLGSPALDVTPTSLYGHSSVHGSKDKDYTAKYKFAFNSKFCSQPTCVLHEITNASLGLCKCEHEYWKTVENGMWHAVMSSYDDRFIDVKFRGDMSGSVTVSVEEDFQRWRLVFLALGFVLLLFAPIVSKWVPFYYSSSMAIGIILVIMIILFQLLWRSPLNSLCLHFF